jgi:hypothetical protein
MATTSSAAPSQSHLGGLRLGRRISGLARFGIEALFGTSRSSDRLLSIEERLVIEPKKTLFLVNCLGRRFLVGTAGSSICPMFEVRPFTEGCPDGSSSSTAFPDGGL